MINVPFVLGTDKGVAEYAHRTASLVGQLTEDYVHIIVVVMDHTDKNTEDLFISPNETGCMTSAVVDEVSTFFFSLPYTP